MVRTKRYAALEWDGRKIRIACGEMYASGIEVTGLRECPVAVSLSTPDKAKRAQALREAISGCGLEGAYLSVVLPRFQVFMRKVTVPSGTPDEIRSMLAFEAEKYIPFAADEAVIDYYPFGTGSGMTTDIMLVVARKELVRDYLSLFREAGLEIGRIGVSTTALQNLVSYTNYGPTETFALLVGGEDSWELDFFVNHAAAVSRGFACMGAPGDADRVGEISREINHSAASFKAGYPDVTPGKVVYGGACGPKYIEALRQHEEWEKVPFDLGRAIPSVSGKADDPDQYAVVVGQLVPGPAAINLLPSEEVVARERAHSRAMTIRLSAAAAVVLLLVGGTYLVSHYHTFVNNRKAARRIADSRQEIAVLQTKTRQLARLESFSGNKLLPLEVLREVNGAMPSDAYLTQFLFNGNTLTIKGRTDSYSAVTRLVSRLVPSPVFLHVVSKGAHAVKVNERNLIDFEVQCDVRSPSRNGADETQ